jgi:hypothetical protein
VSLPEDDVEFLDAAGLADAYVDAWRSWSASEDAAAWDATAGQPAPV